MKQKPLLSLLRVHIILCNEGLLCTKTREICFTGAYSSTVVDNGWFRLEQGRETVVSWETTDQLLLDQLGLSAKFAGVRET